MDFETKTVTIQFKNWAVLSFGVRLRMTTRLLRCLIVKFQETVVKDGGRIIEFLRLRSEELSFSWTCAKREIILGLIQYSKASCAEFLCDYSSEFSNFTPIAPLAPWCFKDITIYYLTAPFWNNMTFMYSTWMYWEF